MALRAFGYVDGGYIRALAGEHDVPWLDPRALCVRALEETAKSARGGMLHEGSAMLVRVAFYDAEKEAHDRYAPYFDRVEALPDTELRMGMLKGEGAHTGGIHQKGVDVLLAIDMLGAAHRQLFDVAVLITGDSDFVPLVEEVRRLGRIVVVGGERGNQSHDLRRAADRVWDVPVSELRGLALPE